MWQMAKSVDSAVRFFSICNMMVDPATMIEIHLELNWPIQNWRDTYGDPHHG